MFCCVRPIIGKFLVFWEGCRPALRRANSREASDLIGGVGRATTAVIRTASRLRATRYGFVGARVFIFLSAYRQDSVSCLYVFHRVRVLRSDSKDCGAVLRVLGPRSFRVFYFGVLRRLLPKAKFNGCPVVRFGDGRLASRVSLGRSTFPAFRGGLFQDGVVRRLVCVIGESFDHRRLSNEGVRGYGAADQFSGVGDYRGIVFLVVWSVVVSQGAQDGWLHGTALRRFLHYLEVFGLIACNRPLAYASRFQRMYVWHVVQGSHRLGNFAFSVNAFYRDGSWCFDYGGHVNEVDFVRISTPRRRRYVQVLDLRIGGLFRRQNWFGVVTRK